MPDEVIEPVQPEITPPVQPAVANPEITDGEQWKERYAGQQKALQFAVEKSKAIEAKHAELALTLEQLKAQLSVKDTEKTVAVGERDKALQDALTKVQSAEAELHTLRALKLKVEVAAELGKPELLEIADHIPNIDDKEILTNIMKDFASFTDKQVKVREDQLTAGISPSIVQPSATPVLPQTAEDWNAYVNEMPVGSKERNKALEQMGDFLGDQHKIKI